MSAFLDIALFFAVSNLVDFTNPVILNTIRLLYLIFSGLHYYLFARIPVLIEQERDERLIWVPLAKSTGANFLDAIFGKTETASSSSSSTTPVSASNYRCLKVYEYEDEIAKKLVESSIQQRIPPLMFSFAMNIHIMLAMQLFRIPMELLKHVLIRKYIIGEDLGFTIQYQGNELYINPETTTMVTNNNTTGNGGSIISSSSFTDGSSGTSTLLRDTDMEEAIFRTWEAAKDPAPIDYIESLVEEKHKNINYTTIDDGWSLLMVISGGEANGKAEIIKLLELGSLPTLTDKERWTALHWACYHNRTYPIQTIVEHYSDTNPNPLIDDSSNGTSSKPKKKKLYLGTTNDLKELLSIRNSKGKTCYRVAFDEKNHKIVQYLSPILAKVGLDEDEMLRIREGEESSTSGSTGSSSSSTTTTLPSNPVINARNEKSSMSKENREKDGKTGSKDKDDNDNDPE